MTTLTTLLTRSAAVLAPLACLAYVLAFATPARAVVKTEEIVYKVGDAEFKGYLCYDDAVTDRRPGVLVCHEWWGCNEYAQQRAKRLADSGYVAFALDMYGKGATTSDPKQAGELAGKLYADPAALRDRAVAGLKVLSGSNRVDPERLAAIGYCMGGTVALELARTGANLKAVTAFHASNITAKDPADNARIKAKVLICHGADDTFVKPGEIDAFVKQMKDANVDSQVIFYGGAVHSFTNAGADKFNIPGVKYNALADRRSWAHMRGLFDEAFSGR